MAKKKPGKAKSRKPSTKNKAAPKAGRTSSKPVSRKTKKASKPAAKRARSVASPRAARQVEPPPPPPARPTGPGVVHWEVQARDPAGQRQFFADLFGWDVDANNPQEYGMVQPGAAGTIGGGIGATLDSPRTTFYIQVEDIASTLAKAETMGAQTVMPRTDIGMIVMGQFRDPEGNLIGLVEPWTQPAEL